MVLVTLLEVRIDGEVVGYAEDNAAGRAAVSQAVWIAMAEDATTARVLYVDRIPQGARRIDREPRVVAA